MATNEVSQGMPIDLSTLPAKCDHCAIGKQTRSTVPKTREGPKADKRLGRVYVDLCSPMAVLSRSKNLYCMNIIDDFSGYVWSVPLRSKSDASSALQTWHKAVTVQTGDSLRILVTDNGELVSKSMKDWCNSLGIDHQLTAPYTSAQNGRAERLHRTLLGKARSMRIACDAPGNLWDEFCSTAAYLTCLTAATANKGRTPYELWFGRVPSLSHLREIGCKAFALINPSPSKIYARSLPCVLIGYAPHSKAYRLWDPVSSHVFNSFHVSFAEHLDTLDTLPFRPGTVLGTATASYPPSWDVSGPAPPEPAVPTQRPHNYDNFFSPLPSIADQSPVSAHFPSITIPSDTNIPNAQSINNVPHQNTVTQQNNTVVHQNNTVPHQNNTVLPQNNTVPPQARNNTVPPQANTVPPQAQNNTASPQATTSPPHVDTASQQNNNVSPQNTVSQLNNNHAIDPPPLTITIPPRPALRRSARLQALHDNNDHAFAFLSHYSSLRDTHDLFPLDITLDAPEPSVDHMLTALSDGSIEPVPADEDDEPLWEHAMASDEREYWIAGRRDELNSLQDLKVFVLVPRSEVPRGHRPLQGKLVCKRKRDDTGKIVRYKVRYVAKGFAQRYGIDYDKTTAPTVRLESFRTILHLAATFDWDLRQFDIKTAFLHGILPEGETMFMEQPAGFEAPGKEEWVMRLMKSIYGMKQASRIWNQTFHNAVSAWGFERLECEWCVYRRSSPTGTIIFVVHVDDIIAAGSSPTEIDSFRDQLKSQWEITELGEPKLALGVAITRDRTKRTISLVQTLKIDPLVREYGQSDARTVDTPMVTGLQLRRPDKSLPVPTDLIDWIDRTPYRRLVGSLMWLAVATRPDIAYTVGRLSSFVDCYRPEHWEAAIRVLRYLKGTRTHALTLGGTGSLTLTGYSDSDYANCIDTSRSIGGYCFALGSGMVSWSSKKQPTVADSSCYAEYIALHDAAHEIVFLRQLLKGLHLLPSDATLLFCDNDAASRLTEDHVWHSHTKHIRVKYHYTRELVLSGDAGIKRVGSKDNIADILTKPLARPDFQRLCHYLGVRPSTGSSSG
jgi:transposase InsO family protein